jgi:xanthine dehydrogenase YagS FAD-binding subunit
VAHKPWRSEKVEALLAGKPAAEQAWLAAADEILAGAKTYQHNAFKVAMARAAIARAFSIAAAGGTES